MINSLTLDQMRVLVAVADAGSFSAAARKLGRVQSAISQAIQTLETTLGVTLFDRSGKTPRLTDAGKALVGDSRALIAGAQAIRARAQSMAEDVEPELTLAVNSMLPIPLLMESLKALRVAFPLLPASVFTEALGGAEQRLRDGAARLAIYTLTPSSPCDLVSEFMTRIAMWPVVAANHPLAALPQPLSREALDPHVQLVLTDRTPLTQNLSGGIRQPPYLAVRGSGHPARFPARRLWLVQHAEPHGLRARRRRPPEEAHARQSRGSRAASLRRA